MARKPNRLPKRVAGMKVPRSLRRSRLGKFLATPVGQVIIADSVLRGGERMLTSASASSPPLQDALARSGAARAEGNALDSAAVAHALRQAARAFVDALHEDRPAQAGAEDAQPARPARPGDGAEKKGPRPDVRSAH